MDLEYIINQFETLDDVAKKFNVSVLKLKEYNNIVSDVPKTILIPENRDVGVRVVVNLKREFVYLGDANSVKQALKNNGFISSNYNDCVTLFKQPNNSVYVVKILDTLNSICEKFKLNKLDVIKLNNLKTDKLFVGQILKLK